MGRRDREPPVDVSIVTSGHDVADARLHRAVAAFRRAGLQVEVLGLGGPGGGPEGAHLRTTPRRGPVGRLLLALGLPWSARGAVLMSLDPDSAIGCAAAARLRRRRWVADVHEDYVALLRDRPWALGLVGNLARAVARMATAVVGTADLTVVADEHLPPTSTRSRRRLVTRNLPDNDVLRPVLDAPTDGLRAVYVGDLRWSRGLKPMVEAIALSPGWVLDLVGPLPAEEEAWLGERLRDPDLASRIRAHGRLNPSASWRVAAGASVGLALLDDTPAFRDAVPTKVYEYLAAGLAVLATPLPRVAPLIAASGGGQIVRTAQEASDYLTGWARRPEELQRLRRAARRWAAATLDGVAEYDELAGEVLRLTWGEGKAAA